MKRAWSLALGEAHPATLSREARDDLASASAAIQRAIDRETGQAQVEAAIQEANKLPEDTGAGMLNAAPAGDAAGASPNDTPKAEAKPDAKAPTRSNGLVDPIKGLVEVVGGRSIPRYVEAQLPVWVGTYLDQRLGLSIEGRRAQVLRRAQEVRLLAEQVAAADERVIVRIAPVLEQADARRREAQDRLFAPEGPATEEAARQLEESSSLYLAAREYVETEAQARDLIARAMIELPYLGTWYARRVRGGLDPQFLGLLDGLEALNTTVEQGLEIPPTSGTDAPTEPTIEVLNRERTELAGKVRSVENPYNALVREFLQLCDLDGSSRGTSRVAEIDDLLRVPLIPADDRAALLAKLHAATQADPLTGEPVAAPEPDATVATEPSEVDPRFWSHAVGLARIETTLLSLGGAKPSDLEGLRSDLESARGATTHPDVAFEAMDRFNRRLRSIRADLATRVRTVSGGPESNRSDAQIAATLHAADRAARALPRPHIVPLAEDAAPDYQLARFLRHGTLRRLGRRLVEDYAPEHALLVFDEAGDWFTAPGLNADLAHAREVGRSRLTLATEPSGSLRMVESEQRLTARTAATGPVPEGLALVALVAERDIPLSILSADLSTDSHESTPSGLVPVGESVGSGERAYVLERTTYATEPIQCVLNPGLFYRGKVVSRPQPLAVMLETAREEVQVVIKDRDDRDFGDQFVDHPSRGYLHYNAHLNYELVLTNTTDKVKDVWVSQKLDGQPAVASRLQIPHTPRTTRKGAR